MQVAAQRKSHNTHRALREWNLTGQCRLLGSTNFQELVSRYNTPKYRLVVRFSRKAIVCQIVYATVAGDVTVAAAYSRELSRYGLSVGLTNYAAAYATGLLLARRTLLKFGLDQTYVGLEEPTGEDYNVEAAEEGPRPFCALLDTGLKRTSTGSKVFAALKVCFRLESILRLCVWCPV